MEVENSTKAEAESPTKTEGKPFSVLEKFRQLKREKEQASVAEPVNNDQPQISSTEFQASTSSSSVPNLPNGVNRGLRNNKGEQELSPMERKRKRILTQMHKGQDEKDVGITEFIREGQGFDVIVKHRFTDFQVNEFNLEGKMAKLTSTDIPIDVIESEPLSTEENPSILTPEQWATLRDIIDKELDTSVDLDVTNFDKDKRQMIHKAVKRRFGVHVRSNTIEADGKKLMKIGYAKFANNNRYCSWPKDRPPYLHFVLYKENGETIETVNVLSKFTNIKANHFGFAGTKDKRAVTTQHMCVCKVTSSRFQRCKKLRGITIGNFSYKNNKLRLGDLKGNRFRIVLRNVKVSNEVIQEGIEHLKEKGFINYFGMQRFGQSGLVPSYEIGRAILNGAWEKATELILKPREGEACYRDVMEARKIWWQTKDPNEALKPLTRKDKSIEGKLLLGLKKYGAKAYTHAFDSLPMKVISMYLHSYQSLIWNRVVSKRFRTFGLKVLPGDLIRVEEPDQNTNEYDNGTEGDEEDEEEPAVETRKQHVHILTEEEAKTTSIYDVVYPMPGYDITLPENEVGAWYKEEIEKEGETLEKFGKLNHRYGVFATYRNMLGCVEDCSWRTVQYSDPDEDLQLTDLQVLQGKDPLSSNPDGPYKAVLIEFNLKASTYATMAIRELTKCDTSTHSQALISNQAREDDIALKKRKLETLPKEPLAEASTSMEDNGQDMGLGFIGFTTPEIATAYDRELFHDRNVAAQTENMLNQLIERNNVTL